MWLVRRLILRLWNFLFPARAEAELHRELESHSRFLADEFQRRGMSAEEAGRAARRHLRMEQTKECHRHERSIPLLEETRQDVRFALKILSKAPSFSMLAILSLATGIAAATIAFAQIDAVFWSPLPVRDAAELRTLSWTAEQQQRPRLTFPHQAFLRLREQNAAFSDAGCQWGFGSSPLAEWGALNFQLVTGGYFPTLGVRPALGRLIEREDDTLGSPSLVAVISYRVWRHVYNGSPDILNKTIEINKIPLRIIGVAPPGFAGLDPAAPREVSVPYAAATVVAPLARSSWNSCVVTARLHPNVTEDQARQETQAWFDAYVRQEVARDSRDARVGITAIERAGSAADLRRAISQPLFVVTGVTAALLLITCANLAGLLLARGSSRQKELATRLAVGARRGRIIRQLLTESLILSAAGGLLGIAVAYAFNPLLPDLLTDLSGRQNSYDPAFTLGLDVALRPRIVVLSVLLTVATGFAFGLMPALKSSRLDLLTALKQPHEFAAGRFRFRTGKALIAAQIGISIVLLMSAGLLIRTVANIASVPVGYDPNGLLFVTVNAARSPAGTPQLARERLLGLPAVTSAAISQWPIYNNATDSILPICIAGHDPGENRMNAEPISDRFFETWGVPIRVGRDFASSGEQGVIVNETFAAKFLGGNAVGREIGLGACPGGIRTIVGVVADHRDRERAALTPMVYLPASFTRATGPVTFAARLAGDARRAVPLVRRLMMDLSASVDGDVVTAIDYRNRTTRQERLLALWLSVFSAIAMFVSCVGIFGTLSYVVSMRTSEIGIRMALGAEPSRVMRLVVGDIQLPIATGIGCGLLAAWWISRWMGSILFGVSGNDPVTIVAVVSLLLATASIAGVLPAHRASRIDPLLALRME